jgi:hypothetical protein
LDTWASHNIITQKNVEKMELELEELKAPIEMHFANGVPHIITLQTRDVFLQLGNWRGKVDLLVSTLKGMECILGMEFITHNNVLKEGHNRLLNIPSNNAIIQMKAHEVPSVGGLTIHLILSKTLENECMGGCGMLMIILMTNGIGGLILFPILDILMGSLSSIMINFLHSTLISYFFILIILSS